MVITFVELGQKMAQLEESLEELKEGSISWEDLAQELSVVYAWLQIEQHQHMSAVEEHSSAMQAHDLLQKTLLIQGYNTLQLEAHEELGKLRKSMNDARCKVMECAFLAHVH